MAPASSKNLSEISLLVECSTARDALLILDKYPEKIALIVDNEKRLLGTITDGDIRRSLLHGETLDSPVERLMNIKFRHVPSGEDHTALLDTFSRELLRQIPVLDDSGRLVKLLLLNDGLLRDPLSNAVVIMAGGKGTRLMPYTENCPKPMIALDGKPMLEILLEQCIRSGFSNFYFSVNYLKEHIIDYFQDGQRWGVSIDYLVEEKPLGTAGSLQLLPGSLKEPFLVINGDVLTRLNLKYLLGFHNENNAAVTMCVRENIFTSPFGVVQTNGIELAGFQEKPSYRHLVNAGLYVVNPQVLPILPTQQYCDIPTLLANVQMGGFRVVVYPIHEYWIDVGRPESLHQANKDWARGVDQ